MFAQNGQHMFKNIYPIP